ncbi:acyl carrier protein [Streptomyces blattellae]|uniref:acyl carrier protein n=1 Tax=Streptomyces blattellae TaxID=2569855 RepID=UPI0012B9D6DB|nr:acyl carrier protein [Streptomyces blattellae]
MTNDTAVNATAVDMEQLRALIAEVLDLDVAEVTDDAEYVKELGVDSLLALEMQLALEQRYGVSITEEELRGAKSLRMTHGLLTAKTAAE